LIEVIKSGAMDFAAKWFHWHGFQLYWKLSENEPEQWVHEEVYTSDEFLELKKIITPVEGCNLEHVVLPLMFYSDLTHLANFGTASLWPLRMYPHGQWNLTHIFPQYVILFIFWPTETNSIMLKLPDIVKDQYKEVYEPTPTKSVLTHLRQELIQAVWKHLLTDEFKQIYKEGIVVKCSDLDLQRLYPCFFCYSADYKEQFVDRDTFVRFTGGGIGHHTT
ncbi:hypothetical protein J132_04424, partial [Termitomyces sp. J132]